MTTVLLADDHAVVRWGLRALLEAEAGFVVVGEAADGLEAVQMVERARPDVLILDLMMPGLGGLEVARQVGRRSPKTRVVLLTVHSGEGYVLEALRSGVTAYVLKDGPASELLEAVREAAAGRRYLGRALSERALSDYARKAESAPGDLYETLTAREREVLHLAAEGLSNPEVAARLFISARTAEVHRANLLRKLGLKGQTDLVRYALRRGILPLDE